MIKKIMKIKQILGFSILAISSAFLLNSCGDGTPNPAPGIDFIAEGGSITGDVTMDGDKAFSIVFNVTDDSKVKTVEVKSVVNGRISPQLDTTINKASAKIKLSRKSYAAIATEVWTITVTDDKGSSTSKSITVTTTSAATGDPLSSFDKDNAGDPFKVWNFLGQKPGAFNILDGITLASGDPATEKDIQDSVVLAEVSQWPARWTSKNGTTFKKVTGYTYDAVLNTGQLEAVWNASGSSMKSMVVNTGDLYIANILAKTSAPARLAGKVLVYIIDVKKTTGDNLDYVQFKFKKKTL